MENFLYYHKKTLIAAAAAVILILWGLWLYGGKSPDTVLYGEAVNVSVSPETAEELGREGAGDLGLDTEKEQILIGTGTEIDTGHPEANAGNGNLEKITASVFAHEIDFMLCSPEVMEYYEGKGALEFGTDVTEADLTDGGEPVMFCIFKNSEHKEEAERFMERTLGPLMEEQG